MAGYGFWLTGLLFVVLIGFVGCKEQRPQSLALWLEMKSEVRAGETVPLKLKVKNKSDSTVTLALGGNLPYDFVVTDSGGKEVWWWLEGKVIEAFLAHRPLNPGEELEFVGEWNQLDRYGKRVLTGIYFVRGLLVTEPPQKLETEPKRLIILPSP